MPPMSEQSNPVVNRLRSHVLQMAPHQASRAAGQLLIDAKAEIERLLRGDFTPEEFQNLCQNKKKLL